jgi:hypothetical protein
VEDFFRLNVNVLLFFINRPATAVAALWRVWTTSLSFCSNSRYLLVVQALWATALRGFVVVHMAALSTSAITSIHKTNPKLQAFT